MVAYTAGDFSWYVGEGSSKKRAKECKKEFQWALQPDVPEMKTAVEEERPKGSQHPFWVRASVAETEQCGDFYFPN